MNQITLNQIEEVISKSLAVFENNIEKKFATKSDLKTVATKDDLGAIATKDDLSTFATKDDLSTFATKDDLNTFATKDDLNTFATKDDLKIMRDEIIEDLTGVIHDFSIHLDEKKANKTDFNYLDARITVLEPKTS